jgi:DNA uptake protein ComE-like DNA-binding protein
MKLQHSTFNIQRSTPKRAERGALGSVEPGSRGSKSERGSILVIVLWVALGLVTIALYFANSMQYELTASDNRANGTAADQAIEGAARYVTMILANYATNGAVPTSDQFKCAGVSIGDARYWLIGRDPNASVNNPTAPVFGLVDEASKLNLNTANTNALLYLPNMTQDFANAIMDWRGTNGLVSLDYTSLGYTAKNQPFETVDELKLVYGASQTLLVGEDLNRNGVLDANEKDLNGNNQLDSGLLEYVTVYTREPNFLLNGSSLTNVSDASATLIKAVLQAASISTSYVNNLTNRPYAGMLAFAMRCKTLGMSDSDFASIYPYITTKTNSYLRNRVNVNTASAAVLEALIMGANANMDQSTAESAAQSLVSYRQQNPQNLNSLMWVVDALGSTSQALTALAAGDYLTTHSYQFTADIAAVGNYGRGYRRVRFVFDVSGGTPVILYRQDLSRLGWALGDKVRQSLLANNSQ